MSHPFHCRVLFRRELQRDVRGRKAARLAEAQRVITGARSDGREKEVEGRWGGSSASHRLGLIRAYRETPEVGFDREPAGKSNVELHEDRRHLPQLSGLMQPHHVVVAGPL